jgi:O-antigen/teichoic acid export membrane protein
LTLKDKAVKGASWSLAGHIIQSLSSFVIGIILARILTPSEYGLVGMAGVFIFVTYVFVDSGFSTALIQKPTCTSADYSTVFYVNLAISIFFFLVLFFTSGPIANFYDEPELVSIIRTLSFLIILYALSIVHRSIITKRIDLKLLNLIHITSQIASGTIGIIMAYKGFGVWSLVWKTLLNQLFINLQFWIFNKWYPTFEFSLKSLKQMFSFSSKLLVSGIINKTYEQLYNLVIGKFFSASELGLYTRANQFKNLPSESLSGAIMSVSFPVFSNVQNDPARLKNIARKLLKATMFVNITAMLGMLAVSRYLLLTLVGEKWVDATIYLQLLCIVGLLYPFHPINLNIITALGRSDLFLRLEIIKKALAIPIVLIGIFTSVKIMIVGMIFTSIISVFINSYYTKQMIDYGIGEQISDISGSFFVGIIMSTAVFFLGLILRGIEENYVVLLVQVFAGVIITLVLAHAIKMDEYVEFKEILFSKVLSKLKK